MNADGPTVFGGASREHQVATAVVQLFARRLGHGPTRARAFHRDLLLVVVLEDTMTVAERSLAKAGMTDDVKALRERFQSLLEDDLKALVTEITGCEVAACMATYSADPDMVIEAFVLEPPVVAVEEPGIDSGR